MSERTPQIQPRRTLLRRVDLLARHAFPTLASLALMLLATLPFGLVDQAALLVALALGCVFFWSLHRPAAMPPWSVFLIGFFLDLLGYLPLGVGVLVLLLTHGAVAWSRRWLARQGFLPVWLTFAAIAAIAAALIWLLTALLRFRLLPLGPALFVGILAVAIYPLLTVLFHRAHRTIAAPENA